MPENVFLAECTCPRCKALTGQRAVPTPPVAPTGVRGGTGAIVEQLDAQCLKQRYLPLVGEQAYRDALRGIPY